MATINLKILNLSREFFFLGDDILSRTDWTAVELESLSGDAISNMFIALDAEWIVSDISIVELRAIVSGVAMAETIVATIPERDALASPQEGDIVLVQDTGTGQWAKYQYYGSAWTEIDNQAANVIPTLQTLTDVSVVLSALEDGKFISYNHTSGSFVLVESIHQALTSSDIKTEYESNLNTNAFTDAEKSKLVTIQTGATANTSIAATNVVLGIPQTAILNVSDSLTDIYLSVASIQTDLLGVSLVGHNHDASYAQALHDHDLAYAGLGHAHAEYALFAHSHLNYALDVHNHDAVYAASIHDHDIRYDLMYSALSHDHNLAYAAAIHNHSALYEEILPTTLLEDQIILKHSNGTYSFMPTDGLVTDVIDDIIPAVGALFSSLHVTSLLADKSDSLHNHDTAYSSIGHNHDILYYVKSEIDAMVPTWKGAYSPVTNYFTGDSVSHEGSSYIALSNNTGIEASTNPLTWDIAASKGDVGLQGIQGVQGVQGAQGSGVPLGGALGYVLKKASSADNDTVWTAPETISSDFVITLGDGADLLSRMATATIPAGWAIQDGQVANHPNFGAGSDTLVITHGLGRMMVEISLWEQSVSGPLIAQGSSRIDLTTQGQVKNSTDLNAVAVINLQALTNTTRELYIYIKLV